jgi:hypothetical protein
MIGKLSVRQQTELFNKMGWPVGEAQSVGPMANGITAEIVLTKRGLEINGFKDRAEAERYGAVLYILMLGTYTKSKNKRLIYAQTDLQAFVNELRAFARSAPATVHYWVQELTKKFDAFIAAHAVTEEQAEAARAAIRAGAGDRWIAVL